MGIYLDFSEETLKNHCPHCDTQSFAFEYLLEKSDHFYVLCDSNPILEGHMLIIPKRHVSCIGEYTFEEFDEFKKIYLKLFQWLTQEYGTIATFEHGKLGQTVFHSHVHFLPFKGHVEQIIPEGHDKLLPIGKLEDLIDIFNRQKQYLFCSIGSNMWVVDNSIGAPRFFRDRFAKQLNRAERADWKKFRKDPQLLAQGRQENLACQKKFKETYSKSLNSLS